MGRHKYKVSAVEDRTWNGRLYASKAEMMYAIDLDAFREAGAIVEYIEQPKCYLGADTVYRADFFVVAATTPIEVYYVDVKGVTTGAFNKIKKLWDKYARIPLHIVKYDYRRKIFYTDEVVASR